MDENAETNTTRAQRANARSAAAAARRTGQRARARAGYGPADAPPGRAEARASSLADIVALVPHRMGFHPRRSLVVVLLDGENHWIATARHDWSPDVPEGAVVAWLLDVAEEAHGFLVGLYGEAEAGRAFLTDLAQALPQLVGGFVVPEPEEPGRVIPATWHGLQSDGWSDHDGEELFGSAMALEEWGAGSVPGLGPQARELHAPGLRQSAAWQRGEAEARDELLLVREWLEASGMGGDEPPGADAAALQAAPRGKGNGAWAPWPADEAEAIAGDDPGSLASVARRGLCSWGFVLDRHGVGDPWWEWNDAERAELVLALRSLPVPGVRDVLLTLTAGGASQADPAEILLGLWEGPVDAGGLLALEEVLESAGGLLPARAKVEALCLLAWIEWARGHGSVAGATLDLANKEWPGHRLTALLRGFIDTGSVPRWLRPSHGGRGGRWDT
ncbi:DUF4192 family protein [Galactobacter valiniphilus]|uniref:DUF4192 family protein n=1 Tax=Galactobacter valiniphilus TaxID=2676122 RepID=UPI0037350BA1